jgi:hypothetical protein
MFVNVLQAPVTHEHRDPIVQATYSIYNIYDNRLFVKLDMFFFLKLAVAAVFN